MTPAGAVRLRANAGTAPAGRTDGAAGSEDLFMTDIDLLEKYEGYQKLSNAGFLSLLSNCY